MAIQTISETRDEDSGSMLGVWLLATGLLIFSFQDVIVRELSGGYPVHQLIFLRGTLAIWMMGFYVYWRYGAAGFRISRPWLVLLRGLIGVTCFTLYYLALAKLTLADTVTITFASPIVIALLAVLVLKEPVGWRRWCAIFFGFTGVVVVVGPTGKFDDPAVLFAVGGTVTYALQNIMTRFLRNGMTGPGIAFYQMALFVVFSGIAGLALGHGAFFDDGQHASIQFFLRPWQIPGWTDYGFIVVTSVIAAVGFVLLTNAYAVSSPSLVAPFEYTGVLWGVMAGWLFLGEVPGGWTLAGASIIVGSGLYILYRETRHGRPARSPHNPVSALPDPPDVDARNPPEAERLLDILSADEKPVEPTVPVEAPRHPA
ncbi:MAG: DMT family transporter [Alphaproteobacteria bacterium]|nr:DMT family transporter [Alphaproteobacteria bacterium]